MKISTIRNILVKQTAVVLAILTFTSGILWYVDYLNSEADDNINRLRSQADSISRQVIDKGAEFTKVVGNLELYDEIKQKKEEEMLTVNKAVLRDVIAGTRSKYYSDDLEVKMEEVKPQIGDKYKRETVFVEASDVMVKLNSLSDLDIFGLMQELHNSFSGVRFNSLKISSLQRLDSAALVAIKDGGFFPVVKGEIGFKLFGLHDISETDKELLTDDGASSQSGRSGEDTRKHIRLRQ